MRDHKGMSDSCAIIICTIVLTGFGCLEMKHDRRSWLAITCILNTHSHVWLLRQFAMIYESSDCLFDNRRFSLPCRLICTSFASSRLLWMNELCNISYLFIQTSTAKRYLVQIMKSPLKRLYCCRYCCNYSGTSCEGLCNCATDYNTSP
jgi:hypothetical protein